MHHFHVGVRTKVFTAILAHLTGREDPREALLFQHEEWVGFVVLELDVVDGLVFLDHAVLQQQGIGLRGGDDPLDVADFFNQKPGLSVGLVLREIAGSSFFEVLGLADVEQFPLGIKMLVNPRFLRHALQDRLDVFGGCHR